MFTTCIIILLICINKINNYMFNFIDNNINTKLEADGLNTS